LQVTVQALGPDGDCATGPEKLCGFRPELLHIKPMGLERRERSVNMQCIFHRYQIFRPRLTKILYYHSTQLF